MRLVMIDNYDSFTYNLSQLFQELDLKVIVFRNDEITTDEIESLGADYLCISPGPKDPAYAGISKAVIERFTGRIPILGVCLGMQAIAEVFSGRVQKAPMPVHGKACRVEHNGKGIFSGLPSPLVAARYHSLCVELASPLIEIIAVADDGVIMGIQHVSEPLCGVQFHPESFLTEYGYELAKNFLSLHPSWRSRSHAAGPKNRISRATFASTTSTPDRPDIRHEISSV